MTGQRAVLGGMGLSQWAAVAGGSFGGQSWGTGVRVFGGQGLLGSSCWMGLVQGFSGGQGAVFSGFSSTLCLPLPQLAYCVVQFLEKDATLTEHVSAPLGGA